MKFKAKLFKLGNSRGIYVPKEVYTNLVVNNEYEWIVYTGKEEDDPSVYTKPLDLNIPKTNKVKFNTAMCSKHEGSMKGTCGCE